MQGKVIDPFDLKLKKRPCHRPDGAPSIFAPPAAAAAGGIAGDVQNKSQ
jgi:hypothetical protein